MMLWRGSVVFLFSPFSTPFDTQVTLNIGGHRFTTTVTTLRNAPSPSLFSAMFSGRHNLVTAGDGCVFVDRDGRHFAAVLNYLRDGQVGLISRGREEDREEPEGGRGVGGSIGPGGFFAIAGRTASLSSLLDNIQIFSLPPKLNYPPLVSFPLFPPLRLQLNYPPDGTDFKYLLELRAEAEYYGLCGLVAQIDRLVWTSDMLPRCYSAT